MGCLVLVRHGESTWNRANRFTGWEDVPLTDTGVVQMQTAGRTLRDRGFEFDVAFTSLLKRAIKSLWIVLEELDQAWIPELKNWALNERHYGALQGLNKAEQARKVGDEQVRQWRRSWDVAPPPLEATGALPDRRYRDLESLPRGESLKDTVARIDPYWRSAIRPHLLEDETVLVVAHGNSLRGLISIVEDVADDLIANLELPTGSIYQILTSPRLAITESGFLSGHGPGDRRTSWIVPH